MSFEVKTFDGKPVNVGTMLGHSLPGVMVDGLDLSVDAVMEIAYYAMTNTDLVPNDPRLEWLERLKKLQKVEGWNPEGTRLGVAA